MLRAASFYAALPSTTAVATAFAATAVVIATALTAEVTAADPSAEVGTRSAVLSRSAGGSTGRIRFLSFHLSSGKRGSAHHSLRLRVAYYSVLRMGASAHSPWRASREDLNDSSYQQEICLRFCV
jgi:hypothetical protein